MNRFRVGCLLTLVSLVGCGDTITGKQCGPNTVEVDGVCTGVDPVVCAEGTLLDPATGSCVVDPATVVCTDGTIKDPSTGNCVIDPASCQDGTVLVGGNCVDPAHTTPDLVEAAEPNGLSLRFGEDSATPAGVITLKPVGEQVVIKGKIAPFQDTDRDGQLDPDIDTYRITVTAPTMLRITADGLHGLAAGFLSVAAVATPSDPLAGWERFGINLAGDTSKRQLFLPASGTYVIGVADTRSLFITGAAVGPNAGAPDFEYYITVAAEDLAPTQLALDANGNAEQTGELAPGETKLFAVPLGTGVNTTTYDVAGVQAQASVVVTNTSGGVTKTKLVADAVDSDDDGSREPATGGTLGIRTGDVQLVAADTVFNYALGNVDFTLFIETRGAGELSKTGQSVAQPTTTRAKVSVDEGRDNLAVFSYDVVTDGEVTGLDLGWSVPVSGVVVDEDFNVTARFTFDALFGFFFEDTWTSYRGLVRHRTAGRYYFVVFDPSLAATTITATSSYAPVPITAITSATPVTQTINPFGSNAFSYDADTSAWEAFKVGAFAGTTTGNISARYIPLDSSFGRIDPLASTCTNGGVDFCADVLTLFSHTYAEAGTTVGRVLLNDPNVRYFVSVRPTTISPAPQIEVDFRPRDHVDLGTLVAGTPVVRANQVLSTTTTVQRYLLRTTVDHSLAVTITPSAGLNTRFQNLNLDETSRGAAVSNGGVGAVDTAQVLQSADGWTAFTVTPISPVTLEAFNLSVVATAPPYTRTAGTTAFADACVGGTAIALQDNDEGFSTANITTPAGFDYFGSAAPTIKVNSNGFLTTETALACTTVGSNCFFGNVVMPTAGNPNGVIAPYWDDLVMSIVCQKTIGTKLVIQWTGTTFNGNQTVSFQAILDGSNDTIELVYSPTQAPTGQTATVGLENQAGTAAIQVGFNTAGTITPGTSILFTPN